MSGEQLLSVVSSVDEAPILNCTLSVRQNPAERKPSNRFRNATNALKLITFGAEKISFVTDEKGTLS